MTVSNEDVAVSNDTNGSQSSFAIGNITFTDMRISMSTFVM